MSENPMTEVDRVLRDRQLDREDLQIQLESAAMAAERGLYATARAQLRGAVWIIDAMETRCGKTA